MIYVDQPSAGSEIAPFDPSDRGFTLGDGVFDTAMVLAGRIVFHKAHRTRLEGSIEALGLRSCAVRLDALEARILAGVDTGVVRFTVTSGAGPRGLLRPNGALPTIVAQLSQLDTRRAFQPLRVRLTAIRRNETSPTSRHKTLSCLDSVDAMRTANAEGADEPLFLNTRGKVACLATANAFVIKGRTILSPPVADGALPGVMRQWILDHAADAGFDVQETSLDPEDFMTADCAFATNSLRLLSPIFLDGRDVRGRQHLPLAALSTALLAELRRQGFEPPFEGIAT